MSKTTCNDPTFVLLLSFLYCKKQNMHKMYLLKKSITDMKDLNIFFYEVAVFISCNLVHCVRLFFSLTVRMLQYKVKLLLSTHNAIIFCRRKVYSG